MKRFFTIVISFVIVCLTVLICTGCYIGPEECGCRGLWYNKICNLEVDAQRFGEGFLSCNCPSRDEYYSGQKIRYITQNDYSVYNTSARAYEDEGFFNTQKFGCRATVSFKKKAYDIKFDVYILCDGGVLLYTSKEMRSAEGAVVIGFTDLESDIYYKTGTLTVHVEVSGYVEA